VRYFTDLEGNHAELVLTHFKNDAIKGTQYLPLAAQMYLGLVLLEKAHHFMNNSSPTLWFGKNSRTMYKEAYWSTICSKALTLEDGRRITAKDFRHLFATSWRDYINSPSTKLADLTTKELDAAAADLMCTSTNALTVAYDDTNRVRGNKVILANWPGFQAFVMRQWDLKSSEQ